MPDGFEDLVMNWRSALTGAVMLCSLLAALYLLRRRVERRAGLALATFVLLACLAAVPTLIGFAGAYDIWPGLTFLPTQTFLLLGPLLVFHARALMIEGALRPYFWLLMPGVLYWVYQLWAFTMLGDYREKWAYNDAVHEPLVVPFVNIATYTLIGGCVVYVALLRRRYLLWLQDTQSDDEPFDASWLLHLVVLMVIATLYWIIKGSVTAWRRFDYFESFPWDFAAMMMIFVIALEALVKLHQPFPKMAQDQAREDIILEPAIGRDWAGEGKRIKAEVVGNQWFLEPGLSLQALSRRYGMNHAYLSRAINEGLGCNFNSFVNTLRVDHAKRLIGEEPQSSLTQIALASGFGSKASFNRAFKQYAGVSPSQFRKNSAQNQGDNELDRAAKRSQMVKIITDQSK